MKHLQIEDICQYVIYLSLNYRKHGPLAPICCKVDHFTRDGRKLNARNVPLRNSKNQKFNAKFHLNAMQYLDFYQYYSIGNYFVHIFFLIFKQTNSCQIEEAYLKSNSSTSSSNTFNFTTTQFAYEINFNQKKQKNLNQKYATEREIRRRPVFIRFELFSFLCPFSSTVTLPSIMVTKWSSD